MGPLLWKAWVALKPGGSSEQEAMNWLDICIGLVVRLGLIVYGEWQDRTMAVKFTDIDYQVFTDAAQYIYEGESPYKRATYRYTPLLAWLLQPNVWFSPLFGKLVFIVFDVLTGYMIFKITKAGGASDTVARICGAVWLYNPLPVTVSSRGNAESIMSFLVLATLKLLQDKQTAFTGIVYALSVHIKIYPVTYAVPIYLLLGNDHHGNRRIKGLERKSTVKELFLPNKDRCVFAITAALALGSLTLVYYYWYGWEFLHHTYLYHVTRKDIRHNFSVYFYMLYLQSNQDDSIIIGLLSFIPQVILLLVFSFKFYRVPALVFFLNTFAFVTFNKVCTSQYFLWYLCLLPILLPNRRKISIVKGATIITLWFLGQGLWLLPAYYLEFEGQNTFIYIWLGGLLFFAINCYIMSVVIENYSDTSIDKGKSSTLKSQSGMDNKFQVKPVTRSATRKNKLKEN